MENEISVDPIDPLDDESLPKALLELQDQLRSEKTYRRFTAYVFGLVLFVIVLLVGVIGVSQTQRSTDRVNQSRNACEGGNRLREQIRNIGGALNDRADNFINTLIAASAISDTKKHTPEEEASSNAAIAEFRRLGNIDSKKIAEVVGQIKDNDCVSLYH